MRPGLLERAVTVSVWFSLAAPAVMLARLTICGPAFSSRVKLPMGFNVGCWLTGLTVTLNVWETRLLLAAPSLTVTVMVAEPMTLVLGASTREPPVLALV